MGEMAGVWMMKGRVESLRLAGANGRVFLGQSGLACLGARAWGR